MKFATLFVAFAFGLIFHVSAQMSEVGYASILLSTEKDAFNKSYKATSLNNYHSEITIDGVRLRIGFHDFEENKFIIQSIESVDKKVRLKGHNGPIIGLKRADIVQQLGDKILPQYEDEEAPTSYYYYSDNNAKTVESRCMIILDEQGVVTSIVATL